MAEVTIRAVEITLESDDVLSELTAEEVVATFKGNLEDLLDEIGKERCMEHFDLIERPE